MKVAMTFDFSDDDREAIVAYNRSRFGVMGVPKLATREMLRDFIQEAIQNQRLSLADELQESNNENR
jgi:hypothetical protein